VLDSARVICVIPARGGSKRVPEKNLTMVAGKPLIVHTIDHALAAQTVGRVIVSTDSEEIADVAAQRGSEVVRRPIAISGDQASSEDAILHVLDELDRNEGFTPDLIVFLQCTAPVRAPKNIDEAVHKLNAEGADSLLSVVQKKMFLWAISDGRPEPINYEVDARPRSQEMAPIYVENGSIYVLKPAILRTHNNRLGGKVSVYVMPDEATIDVDTPFDLELCRFVLERRRS
jgi:CMP-N,N'-diacetyllegionaminic acid synthase